MQEYKVTVTESAPGYMPTIKFYKPGTNELHRVDGPAVRCPDGTKKWYLNGVLSREDGPAVEYTNGLKFWYIDDVQYTEQEFLARTAPAKEMTMAELEKVLGHKVKIVK